MKKLLNEEIIYRVVKPRGAKGKSFIFINGTNSASLQTIRDNANVIKNHGGEFHKQMKKWVWWLSDNEDDVKSQLRNFVIPCIEDLTSIDKGDETADLDETTKNTINDLIESLNNVLKLKIDPNDLGEDVSVDVAEIQKKVLSFKNRLMEITSSQEFKDLFEPIIKMRQSLGPEYSILNTILIYIQDPRATVVKTRANWKKWNRDVIRGSHVIALYMPHGEYVYDTPEKREACTTDFLEERGKESVDDLTIGEREELEKELKRVKNVKYYTLVPAWYDKRHTEVIKGKKDQLPSSEKATGSIPPWFSDLPATKRTGVLYDAIVKSIEGLNIKITYSQDLNGALGVSHGGWIELLDPNISGKTIGAVNTAVHELAHEILHHIYLKHSQPGEFGEYFVGRKNSRATREQQAEVIAWIVCSYYGYELETSTNYMGCWGMNADLAPKVFDAVADAANIIIVRMNKNMKSGINEDISANGPFTGEKIAELVGLGGFYRRHANKKRGINEDEIREAIKKVLTK